MYIVNSGILYFDLMASNMNDSNFLSRVPTYIKLIVSLLFLLALTWLGLRACSSTPLPQKTFVIAMDRSWYPLQLMNKDKNMSAFSDVLIRQIAQDKSLKVQVIEAGSTLFQGLESGVYDGVISALSLPALHPENYLVSDVIYKTGPVLVVGKSSTANSLKDLAGKNVGVVGNLTTLHVDDFPAIVFINYDSATSAFADLDNDIIDGVIIDVLRANSYIQGLYAGRIKVVTAPYTNEGLHLVMNRDKDSEQFIKLFNEGLHKLIASGEYTSLINAWGLISTEDPTVKSK